MQRNDVKLNFIVKWYKMGKIAKDPFDKFFFYWTTIGVASQDYRFREDESDKGRIFNYFYENLNTVFQVLEDNQDRMTVLASHRGADYEDPIIDTKNVVVREKLRILSSRYTKTGDSSVSFLPSELVNAVAELLIRIRYSLFQGGNHDDRRDAPVLTTVNPILEGILRACEPYLNSESSSQEG